jgi:hypothetical protein
MLATPGVDSIFLEAAFLLPTCCPYRAFRVPIFKPTTRFISVFCKPSPNQNPHTCIHRCLICVKKAGVGNITPTPKDLRSIVFVSTQINRMPMKEYFGKFVFQIRMMVKPKTLDL